MFDELRYWIILGSDLDDVLRLIDDRAFGLSTDLIIAVPTSSSRDQYELYDVYNMSRERGSALNITFFGRWMPKLGLSVSLVQTKFQRRSDIRGLTLRAAFFKAS